MTSTPNLDRLSSLQDRDRCAVSKSEMASPVADKAAAIREDKRQLMIWRGAVFTRDKNRCQRCGVKVTRTVERVPNRAEAHHICERAHLATRYDVRNGLTMCASCHERLTGTVGAPKLFVIGTKFFTLKNKTYVDCNSPVTFSETKPV